MAWLAKGERWGGTPPYKWYQSQMTQEQLIVELHHGVGRALTSWAGVEISMCRVYCQAVSPETYHPKFGSSVSARTFWALHSLQQKLRITDETCKARYLFGEYPEKWGELKKSIKAENSVRNRIAHGMVVAHTATSAQANDAYLQPFPMTRSDGLTYIPAGQAEEHDPLRTGDLLAASERFSALGARLREFTYDVFAHYHPDADLNTWPIGADPADITSDLA